MALLLKNKDVINCTSALYRLQAGDENDQSKGLT